MRPIIGWPIAIILALLTVGAYLNGDAINEWIRDNSVVTQEGFVLETMQLDPEMAALIAVGIAHDTLIASSRSTVRFNDQVQALVTTSACSEAKSIE